MEVMEEAGRSIRSPPSRGAWIEISVRVGIQYRVAVAPLAGGVD